MIHIGAIELVAPQKKYDEYLMIVWKTSFYEAEVFEKQMKSSNVSS